MLPVASFLSLVVSTTAYLWLCREAGSVRCLEAEAGGCLRLDCPEIGLQIWIFSSDLRILGLGRGDRTEIRIFRRICGCGIRARRSDRKRDFRRIGGSRIRTRRTDRNDCFGRNVQGPRELRRIAGSKIGPPRSDRALVNPRRTDRNDCFGRISGSGIQTGRSDRKDLGSILRRPETPENGPERLLWSDLRVRFRTILVNVGSRNRIKPGRSDRSIGQQ